MRQLWTVLGVVIVLGFAGSARCKPADEFVRVSADGWHFETSVTRERFVPFGGVYYDPATYTDLWFPRFLVISKFDEARTDSHLSDIAGLGASLVRVTLSTGSMCPEYGKLDPQAAATVDRILALAAKHNLRVMLDLLVEWEGHAGWFVEQWAHDKTIKGLELYFSAVADHCKDNPVIFSYLIADEPRMAWATQAMRTAWGDWARRKYRCEEELRKAWSDYPKSGETWQNIAVPEDKPDRESSRLYDYQLFREDLAARYARTLCSAIRSADKNHLISLSNVQWAAPFRFAGMEEALAKPSSYAAFAPDKIGKYLDYLQINCYDWWDSHTPIYAQALGRYSHYPGKPVLMGEFSFDPEVVERCAGTFAGFQCWACYTLPSEPTLHYLFDPKEKPTKHAEDFAGVAARIRSGGLVFDRKPDEDVISIDMKRVLCEPAYGADIYKNYLDKCGSGRALGVKLTR